MAGNEVEIVVTSKDKTGPGISGAEQSVSRFSRSMDAVKRRSDEGGESVNRYGQHVDRLAERADNSERNLIGLHDVVDGTAAIMAGPGEQGIVAYIQGWADLAGGLAPLIPMLKNLSKEVLVNAANTVRSGVVQTVAAVKARALAVAQGVLNAVMSANPILLVVLAIAALVAIFIVAYKHSETFRRIVQAAFRAVTAAASAAWNWIKGHWPLLLAVLTGPIGLAVLAITRNWDRIRSGAVTAWNAVVSFFRGVPGRIKSALGDLGSLLYQAGRNVIQGLIDGIKSMISNVASTIGSVAQTVRNFLPFSPAKEGPLSGSGSPFLAGQKIAGMVAGGITSGRRGIAGAMGGALQPAAGGLGAGGPIILEIRSGGSRLDDLLVEVISKAIRANPGFAKVVRGAA